MNGKWTCITRVGHLAAITAAVLLFGAHLVSANPAGKAAQEVMEYFAKRFGREMAEAGAEQTSKRAARLLARHGDELLPVLKELGPVGLKQLDALPDDAVRVVRRLGPQALPAVANQADVCVRLVARYGDEAGELLVRHPGVAENLANTYGKSAIGPLARLNSENAVRLAKLADDFDKLSPEAKRTFLEKLAQAGDDFVVWVYKRRGEIFTTIALGGAAGVTGAAVLSSYEAGMGMAENAPDHFLPPPATPPDPATQPFWALLDRSRGIFILGVVVLLIALFCVHRAWPAVPNRAHGSTVANASVESPNN